MPGNGIVILNTWRGIYAAALLSLLAGLLHHHWQIITTPVPLDLYEGVMPLITGIIADGHNPYTRAFQPQAMDVYPPLYNMLVAPLTLLFDNSLQLHRSVSALFITLSALLCGAATHRHGTSPMQGLAAAVMCYAALLFYITPVASTNAMGVFLFLLSVLLPWWRGFSTHSLLLALLCGLLAFYTKQYFVLGIAILCLYLFLYVSQRRALLLGFSYATLLLSSLWLVHLTSPYYLDNTLFAAVISIYKFLHWQTLFPQLQFFITTYSGLLALLILLALSRLSRHRCDDQRPRRAWRWAGGGWRGPLLTPAVDYFWFGLCWSSLAIVLWLGRNPGNYVTYLFQLMSPFLLIGGFSAVARMPRRLNAAAPLLLISLYLAYDILPKDFSFDADNWERMESIMAEQEDILATQMLLPILLKQNKRVYQDGHTFYFPFAANKPPLFLKEEPESRVTQVWEAYMTDLYRRVQRCEFDLILISVWELNGIFLQNPPPFSELDGPSFLQRHYQMEQKIRLSMTARRGGGSHNIQVWRPRTEHCAAD